MKFWKPPVSKRIYADAAAATPLSARSRAELVRLLDVYGNAGALHKEGVMAKEELERARAAVAQSTGAHSSEIVFTSSGTEGNNLAIQGCIRQMGTICRTVDGHHLHGHHLQKLHAITSAIEHQSVLEPLRALKREGLEVTELPVDSEGFVSPKQLAEAVTDKTVFVSVQLVNSEVGTIEPIKEIVKQIRNVRKLRDESLLRSPSEALTTQAFVSQLPIYLHTDASQAPFWMDIGVEQLGVDLMTLDGQKVLGPKGVGALYVRRPGRAGGIKIEPILWGGSQERGLRGGTPNVPLAGAFAAALADAQSGVEERAAKVTGVRDFCWNEIKRLLPDAILNGPSIGLGTDPARVANNINVSIPGLDAQMAVIALDAEGIAASTRSACNVGEQEPSHVIQALGVPKNLAGTAVRITFLPDITKDDARIIAQKLFEIASRYRQ
ncbi:MAG: cysteine desulfurase [Patescibacteria group bacterium]|nr:cysteine desulfurase [Patescibacteria group bacterium]